MSEHGPHPEHEFSMKINAREYFKKESNILGEERKEGTQKVETARLKSYLDRLVNLIDSSVNIEAKRLEEGFKILRETAVSIEKWLEGIEDIPETDPWQKKRETAQRRITENQMIVSIATMLK